MSTADGSPDALSTESADNAPAASAKALYFYGVARARTWRGGLMGRGEDDVQRIRYRDLEALVQPASYVMPIMDEERVLAHQRVVDNAMRRATVLPAPFGVIFRGRRQLIRLLQDQYIVLDEGLAFLDGHWELRLHITPSTPGDPPPEIADVAMQLYAELRRQARAAVPFPSEGRRLLSAAFLVDRNVWVEFVDRAEDLGTGHPELAFDVTGPWPAYDFVRITS